MHNLHFDILFWRISKGANNCGTCGFVEKQLFFDDDFIFLRMNLVGCFYFFQCEIKLVHQMVKK